MKSVAGEGSGHISSFGFCTPTGEAKNSGEGESSQGGASNHDDPIVQKHERRILKPPPSQRLPYVNLEVKKDFNCLAKVNRFYALVMLIGGAGTGTTRT